MKKFLMLCLLISLLLVDYVGAKGLVLSKNEFVKIDPLMKMVMAKEGIIYSRFQPRIKVESLKINKFYYPVYIISSNPDDTFLGLSGLGYRFRIVRKTDPFLLIGRIDIRDIMLIKGLSSVEYIGLLTPKRLYLNKSIPLIKADLVHSQYRLPFAVTGKNVVLGITDTGLDYTHQDFISESGDIRTKYIWYQDVNPEDKKSPPEYGYGDECDTERIKSKECPYKDIIGHGTHCSGIMGSDSKKYKGLAPEGVFVVAKSGTFNNLADGIEYVLKRAELLKMPVVINMSLGGHYGPHDGTSPEELAIAEFLKNGEEKGKVIVVAAGNEGSSNIHLGYTAEDSAKKTLLNLRNSSGPAIINLWRQKEGSLSISIGIADESLNELGETESFDGSNGGTYELIYDNKKYAEVYFDVALYPPDNKYLYLITIDQHCSDCLSSDFNFYIKVKGDIYFDAWFADEDFFSGGSSFSVRSDNGLVPGDSYRTIGMPATSPYVISVAASVSRKEYTDIDGNVHTLKDNVGDIAYFSSIGPSGDESRTGKKPDITAPGRIIISAFSSDAIQLQAGTQVDKIHIAMQGTSMACPHISGLVGLLLSVNPELTSNQVKRIIRLTASKPYEGFSGFDYRWGYGLVNAYEAVRMALKIGFCEDERECNEEMVCRNNYCRGLIKSPCKETLDCDTSLVCEEGSCRSPAGGVCTSDGDCSKGLSCIDARCVTILEGNSNEHSSEGMGCSCNILDVL
jgi:subtilisin family serine protease